MEVFPPGIKEAKGRSNHWHTETFRVSRFSLMQKTEMSVLDIKTFKRVMGQRKKLEKHLFTTVQEGWD